MHTPEELLALLAELGIPFSFQEHQAVYTVAESASVRQNQNGALCKCLFLKTAEPVYWLVVMPADERLDLKGTAAKLNSKRLSFASPEEMREFLGLEPGSVTPFGIINDASGAVRVAVAGSVCRAQKPLLFHPLVNTATIGVSADGLMRFLKHLSREAAVFELQADEAGAE